MSDDTQYIFFSGKGGVGKTTMACATAEYRERILAPMRTVMPENVIKVMEEQFNSPCTTEIASFDRFVDFMTSENNDDGVPYDVVIFDTAPTGHTLRLLELPFDYADQVGMMVATSGDGQSVKGETQRRFDRIIAQMKDPERNLFAFVVYPESTPVVEAYRAMVDLRAAGIETQFVVANQVLQPQYCNNDYFRNRRLMQEKYLEEINSRFQLPVSVMPLFETEITGLGMVERAADALFAAADAVSRDEAQVTETEDRKK